MSAKRLVISSMAVVTLMAVGSWYAVGLFPLAEAARQILQKTPGPLESAANPITPENPIPRRLHHEPAQYPPEAAAENVWVSVTLRLTIDSTGAVAEARVTGARARLRGQPASLNEVQAAFAAVVSAAVNAVEKWRYDAPSNPPVSFDTTFLFSPGVLVSDTLSAAAPPPPPPPPPPPGSAPNRLQDDKAIRVGGNIQPPVKIKDVRPVYPPDALDAKIQGVVIVEIRIDETGRVSDAAILRSIPELDDAALAAIRQWEFQPTLLNGVPRPVIMVATINFTLK